MCRTSMRKCLLLKVVGQHQNHNLVTLTSMPTMNTIPLCQPKIAELLNGISWESQDVV